MPLGFIDANTNWGKYKVHGLANKDPIGNSGSEHRLSRRLDFPTEI